MTSSLSPVEIYERLVTVIKGYQEALDCYSDEQFTHKSAEDVWSLGQMYEHLVLTSNFSFWPIPYAVLSGAKVNWAEKKANTGIISLNTTAFHPLKSKFLRR